MKTLFLGISGLVVAVGSLAACSGSSGSSGTEPEDSGVDAGGAASPNGASKTDSGTSGATDSGSEKGGSSKEDGGVQGSGFILLLNNESYGTPTVTVYATAQFSPPAPADAGAVMSETCAQTITMGSCNYTCFNTTPTTTAAPAADDSAGTLTITGGDFPISLLPGDGGEYSLTRNDLDGGRIFDPGAMLAVSASGAAVPAFSNEEATGPSDIVLTAPTRVTVDGGSPSSGYYAIDTTADLPVSWTGGETGTTAEIQIVIFGSTEQMIVNCTADASLHQMTIPHQVLAPLASALADAGPLGGSVDGVTFFVTSLRYTSFQVGSFATTFMAETSQGNNVELF